MPQRNVWLFGLSLFFLTSTSVALAQEPTAPDTVYGDTLPVRELPEITVTRAPEPLDRVPYAVGVLDRNALQRGQQTVGVD